jgi:hypothetical protein
MDGFAALHHLNATFHTATPSWKKQESLISKGSIRAISRLFQVVE